MNDQTNDVKNNTNEVEITETKAEETEGKIQLGTGECALVLRNDDLSELHVIYGFSENEEENPQDASTYNRILTMLALHKILVSQPDIIREFAKLVELDLTKNDTGPVSGQRN